MVFFSSLARVTSFQVNRENKKCRLAGWTATLSRCVKKIFRRGKIRFRAFHFFVAKNPSWCKKGEESRERVGGGRRGVKGNLKKKDIARFQSPPLVGGRRSWETECMQNLESQEKILVTCVSYFFFFFCCTHQVASLKFLVEILGSQRSSFFFRLLLASFLSAENSGWKPSTSEEGEDLRKGLLSHTTTSTSFSSSIWENYQKKTFPRLWWSVKWNEKRKEKRRRKRTNTAKQQISSRAQVQWNLDVTSWTARSAP